VSIKGLVPQKFVHRAVELVGAGLGLYFDRTGGIAAILGAKVRGQYANFTDGLDAGIDVEGLVAPIIHVVAAINLPVIVLHAATIDAVVHVALRTYGALILSSLVADAGHERHQLGKIPAIQLKFGYFLAGNRARQF